MLSAYKTKCNVCIVINWVQCKSILMEISIFVVIFFLRYNLTCFLRLKVTRNKFKCSRIHSTFIAENIFWLSIAIKLDESGAHEKLIWIKWNGLPIISDLQQPETKLHQKGARSFSSIIKLFIEYLPMLQKNYIVVKLFCWINKLNWKLSPSNTISL